MPGLNSKDIYLLYRATGTGAGPGIGNAEVERYARGAGVNRKGFPWYTKIRITARDTSTGGSAIFQIQTSPDNSTWTTLAWSPTLTIPATGPFVASISKLLKMPLVSGVWNNWLRINVSTFNQGTALTLDAYMTVGGYGT